MKKAIIAICLTIGSLGLVQAQGGKEFSEGKVTYEIKVEGDVEEEMAAMMPTEMTVFVKGTKSRTEIKMAMGVDQIAISDSKDNSAVMLLDIMGNKMAMKMNAKDMPAPKEGEKASVTLLDEYKEIAGFKCRKAELKSSKGEVMTVFFTNEIKARIGSSANPDYKLIDGYLMEFSTPMRGIGNMRMTAKTIESQKIDDSNFAVPADYKETTQEELRKMFGGGGGN